MYLRFSSIVRLSTLAALSLVNLLGTPTQAADVYVPTGSYTVSDNTHQNDTFFIGMDNMGYTKSAYTGTLQVTGGSVDGYISGFSNSTINISDGFVGIARALNTSTLNISGGTVENASSADNGTVKISGGIVGVVESGGNSIANISSGTVSVEAIAFGTSTMSIRGGTVQNVTSIEGSTVNISGGNIHRTTSFGSSVINIRGGTIDLVQAIIGTTTISSGSIGEIYGAEDPSIINVTGWTSGPSAIRLRDYSVLNLTGSGLGFSSGVSGTDQYGDYNSYILSGTLANGKRIDGTTLYDYAGGFSVGGSEGNNSLFLHYGEVATSAAPEPGTFALLALGVIGFIGRRTYRAPGSR